MASWTRKLANLFGWGPARPPIRRSGPEDQMYGTYNPADSTNVADRYHDELAYRKARRQDRYDVYDAMDRMADVASVLDAYAEDSTQVDRQHELVVWVESKDKKVRDELTQLFKTIQVEDWIEANCRDTGKYGDDFARVYGDPKNGITALSWLDPKEVERIEDRAGILLGFEFTRLLGSYKKKVEENPKAKPTLKPWEVLHFRLYRQKRLPHQKHRNIYGTSLLYSSDRIAKQVKILDDLLMIVRLTRSLDRRIYYVDVGRSPVEEEVRILKRWRRALKRKTYIDPVEARFDSRFNPYAWCLTGDTSISLLDGRERTIEQLLEEYGTDNHFWVYSRDKEGNIVPGKAKCVGKTRLNAELVRVTIDNGKSIRCTPDHRWMMKDGSYKQAKDLKPGDSLSPLYRKIGKKRKYEYVLQDVTTLEYELTHQMVARELLDFELGLGDQVHHDDRNKRNNNPDNLIVMTQEEHFELHSRDDSQDALKSNKARVSRSDAMFDRWTRDDELRNKLSKAVSESWDDEKNRVNRIAAVAARNSRLYHEDPIHLEQMIKNLQRRYYALVEEVVEVMIDHGYDPLTEWDEAKKTLYELGLIPGNTPRWDKAEGYILDTNLDDDSNLNGLNHKVSNVETLLEREDTYDLSVENHNNFATTVGVILHNSEDEFWPTKENTNSRVEVISGLGSVGEAVDIDHFRDKFFGSLRAPKAYFGYEGDVNAKATLSSQSIKWGRAVESLQRAIRVGLTRLCQIHLAYKGMNTDAENFTVMMVPPSNLELLDRLESWQTIIDVAERMSTLGETLNLDKYDWTVYILENALWLSKDEVRKFAKKIPKEPEEEEPPQPPPPQPKKEPDEPEEPPEKPPEKSKEPKEPEKKTDKGKQERLEEIDVAIRRAIARRKIHGVPKSELPTVEEESTEQEPDRSGVVDDDWDDFDVPDDAQ